MFKKKISKATTALNNETLAVARESYDQTATGMRDITSQVAHVRQLLSNTNSCFKEQRA